MRNVGHNSFYQTGHLNLCSTATVCATNFRSTLGIATDAMKEQPLGRLVMGGRVGETCGGEVWMGERQAYRKEESA